MTTIAPTDGRLLSNRKLSDRQRAVLKAVISAETGISTVEIANKVIRGAHAATQAGRTLHQLEARSFVRQRKDGLFIPTAKGRKAF